ncbi:MAG TPA: HAMP domain-containing sensor histidine kinase [Candidatus Saccharimonadales bacterium]|nr:HAMP domain-containing sensor histidine kinase [Candidatus Saccharimonadales bacterium]
MSTMQGEHEQFRGGLIGDGIPSLVAAAHELKSPLALVRQLSLMLESGDVSPEDQKQMLRQISLTSERALRLTSDLTKSVRLKDALFELEPINPAALCEDIVHEMTPLFQAHGRSIALKSRKHSLLLVANRDLLRRIIVNFSDNALHYAGVDSRVEINIQTLNRGETIRLGVRDFGPALTNDIWKSLHDKLTSAPQAVHARPQSSGLGLYIASQFADAMKGNIGAKRHRDGATFYVDLQASRQLSLL